MTPALLVAIGGAIGSVARFKLSQIVSLQTATSAFPYGTFVVNVIGCLAIGVLAGHTGRSAWLSADARLLLMTGLLGGFTTFSAFGLETFLLLRRGDLLVAAGYAGLSVVVGVAAVAAGMALSGTGAR